jgi:GH25 family lysozyme M1 (1,4-beta-N-acetylmuramidase)
MTLFFPDVASYEAGIRLDGMSLISVKATEGTSYTNPDYARVAGDARHRGLPLIAYHFLRHDSSPAQQATHCHDVVGSGTPVMLDVETATNGSCATADDAVNFTMALKKLGGNPRLIYLPKWYWQDKLGSPDLTPLVKAGLLLVSSNYTSYSDTGPGWAPYGGMTPVVWQYTDRYALNGFAVDHNAFRGNINDFVTLLQTGQQDVNLNDPVQSTASPGMDYRTVEQVLSDMWNVIMRSKAAGGAMWPESPFTTLLKAAAQPAPLAVSLTDAQVKQLVDGLVAQLPHVSAADVKAAVVAVLHSTNAGQ